MKCLGLLAAMSVGLMVVTARGQEADRKVLAEELLGAMNMQASVARSLAMVKHMVPAQVESVQRAMGQTNANAAVSVQTQKIMEMVAEEMSWDKIKSDYIALYADTFTAEELKGLIDFYKSPAGQAYIDKQPELTKKSMTINQQNIARILPRIQEMGQASEEQAPVVPPPSPAGAK